MEEQVIVLYAGTNGFVDDYPVSALGRYEAEMMAFMRSRKKELIDTLRTTGKMDDVKNAEGKKSMGDVEKQLRDALTEFAKTFSVEKA
jgi:F-type H+-transporting ATPase subunit alpha